MVGDAFKTSIVLDEIPDENAVIPMVLPLVRGWGISWMAPAQKC
ncbi:hypothetical protein JCM19240_578 [Vibrio maritimus]|uniref:Uncharacterized protein n=1 Tax=Vibrio maritimus TaxID=990268 RepID=A0A090T702_9VIBR|nr:hypothetical protein JCM19240_578 [Vibrio maritimus]